MSGVFGFPVVQRVLALLLGVALASIVAAAAGMYWCTGLWTAIQPEWTYRWTYEATMPLGAPPRDAICPGVPGSLWIRSTATRELVDPLLRSMTRGGGRILRSEFSGHWAETRVVEFVLGEGSVTIRARFDTDCGRFPGSVAVQESQVHQHEDELCFDLSVRRMDGSSTLERWIGSIQLR